MRYRRAVLTETPSRSIASAVVTCSVPITYSNDGLEPRLLRDEARRAESTARPDPGLTVGGRIGLEQRHLPEEDPDPSVVQPGDEACGVGPGAAGREAVIGKLMGRAVLVDRILGVANIEAALDLGLCPRLEDHRRCSPSACSRRADGLRRLNSSPTESSTNQARR